MAAVHNYGPGERKWGHDYVIHQIVDGGQTLKVSGFGWGSAGYGYEIAAGDALILDNEGAPVRYRVASIEYYRDPRDMWRATLTFWPRRLICEKSRKVAEGYELFTCHANCTQVLRVNCGEHYHAYPFPDGQRGLKALYAKLEELTEALP